MIFYKIYNGKIPERLKFIFQKPYDPVERLEGIDLEGYLSHHHDMIVLNAIDSTSRVTEEYVKEEQQKYVITFAFTI